MNKLPLWLRRLLSFKHIHYYELHSNSEQVWLECACKHQENVPTHRLAEAYIKLRERDYAWGETP